MTRPRGEPPRSWSQRHREDVKLARDTVLVSAGVWMLVHETLASSAGRPLVIGAGLLLVGLPPALRLDDFLRGLRGKDE